ncbi:MAG: DUF5050 domain-containing protein [Clostridiales bacterium]|nr:DUF5050 domain-containing protein [Clostridiales bacterium]
MRLGLRILIVILTIILILLGGFLLYERFGGELPLRGRESTAEEEPAEPETTEPETTQRFLEEIEFVEYDISASKTGNLLGNLNHTYQGAVCAKSGFVYYAPQSGGLYRMNQDTEENAKLSVKGGDDFVFTYLNVVGSRLYFIEGESQALYRLDLNSGTATKLTDQAQACLVYDTTVYYLNGGVYKIDGDGNTTVLYEADAGEELEFAGLSNTRIYFKSNAGGDAGDDYWYSVDVGNPEDCREFLEPTKAGELAGMQYVDGWLYYTRTGERTLHRVQIGAGKEEQLAGDVDDFIVQVNCIYYGHTDAQAGEYQVWELNTKTEETKMVTLFPDAAAGNTLDCFAAGEYIFVYGQTADGGAWRLSRNSIYTAANDLMYYKNGTWQFSAD